MKHFLLCGLLTCSLILPLIAQDDTPLTRSKAIDQLSSMTKDSSILPIQPYDANTQKGSTALQAYKVSVKMTIHSNRDQIKRLNFGYQDQITVFLNGENIYLNSKGYSTHSSPLQATNELFDYLFIPLRKGINQVVLEGLQTPGGIGIRGRWVDLKEVKLR